MPLLQGDVNCPRETKKKRTSLLNKKILLDSNSALSLHKEQDKNLLDELAMGKELERDH